MIRRVVVLLAAFALLNAGSAWPKAGGVSGKAEQGCGECHGPSSPVASVTITPATTEQGLDLSVDVQESDPTSLRGGFDLSVSGGSLSLLSGDNTVQIGGLEAFHTLAGSQERTWTVHWSPQPPSVCDFVFHAAGLAADGDESPNGDHWNLAAPVALPPLEDSGTFPTDPHFLSPRAGDFSLNGLSIGLPGESITGGTTVIAGKAVPLEVAVQDETGIASVEFSAERPLGGPIFIGSGSYQATDPKKGILFQFLWDTTAYLPGSYKLKAKATDCGGNSVTKELDVIVLSGGLK